MAEIINTNETNEMRIDVGVCTYIDIDFSAFDFTGVKEVILTVKNYPAADQPAIIERSFSEAKNYTVVITAEESIKLKPTAEFDFNTVLENGDRVKEGDNGKIVLRKGVGDCID